MAQVACHICWIWMINRQIMPVMSQAWAALTNTQPLKNKEWRKSITTAPRQWPLMARTCALPSKIVATNLPVAPSLAARSAAPAQTEIPTQSARALIQENPSVVEAYISRQTISEAQDKMVKFWSKICRLGAESCIIAKTKKCIWRKRFQSEVSLS